MLWAGIDMDCSSSPIADLLNFGCTNLSFGLRIVKIRGVKRLMKKDSRAWMKMVLPIHSLVFFEGVE